MFSKGTRPYDLPDRSTIKITKSPICNYLDRFVPRRFSPTAQEKVIKFLGIYEKTLRNTYVDNFMDSFDTEYEVIYIHMALQDGHQRGGFTYTKWMPSSKKILRIIPIELRLDSSLDLDFDELR